MSNPLWRGIPLRSPPRPIDDVAERAVVHVHDAPPQHTPHINVEGVPPMQVIVEERREQVVGRRDGVEVAGEVQVDIVRREKQGAATTRGAPLEPERRTEGRLAKHRTGPDANMGESLGKADARCGLALAGGGRRHRRDEHQPPRAASVGQARRATPWPCPHPTPSGGPDGARGRRQPREWSGPLCSPDPRNETCEPAPSTRSPSWGTSRPGPRG